MAQHNNIFREIMGTDIQHTGITTFVVRGFYNALEDPTHDEGFDDIIQCNFVPDFPDEESRQIYNLILSEKWMTWAVLSTFHSIPMILSYFRPALLSIRVKQNALKPSIDSCRWRFIASKYLHWRSVSLERRF